MIDKKFRDKVNELNELPLSQEAKRFLKLAGDYPDPSYLFVIQLLMWGIEQGWRPEGVEDVYEEFVMRLLEDPPQWVWNYLTKDWDGEESVDETSLKSLETPEEGVRVLSDVLLTKLQSDEKLYPIFS